MARGGRMSGGIRGTGSYGDGSTRDPRLAPGGARMARSAMQEKNRAAREQLQATVAAKKAAAAETPKPGLNARIEALPSVQGLRDVPREKAGRMAEVYRNTSNRLGATGDTGEAQRAARRAEVLGKIAAGKPAPAAPVNAAPTPSPAPTPKPKAAKSRVHAERGSATTPKPDIEKLPATKVKAMVLEAGLKPARSKQQMIAALKAKGITAPTPAATKLDIGGRVAQRAAELSLPKPSAPPIKIAPPAPIRVPPPPLPTNDTHLGLPSGAKPTAPAAKGLTPGKAVGIGAAAGITAAMLFAANKAKAEGLGAAGQAKAAGSEGVKQGATAVVGTAGLGLATAGLMRAGMGLTPAGLAVSGALMAKGVWDHRHEGFGGMIKGAYDASPVGMAINGVTALGSAAKERFSQAQTDFHAAHMGAPSTGDTYQRTRHDYRSGKEITETVRKRGLGGQ